MRRNIQSKYFNLLNLLFLMMFLSQDHSVKAQTLDEIPKLHFQQFLDGLSQSNARAIVEDHRGYIWIGTDGGLNRFDGISVKIFEMNESDSASIPDNRINDLYIDSRQNLWIATYNALALYVEKFENFIIFNKKPQEGEEAYLDALTLIEDKDGQLWIGTHHGLFVVDTALGHLTRSPFSEMNKVESMVIHSIEEVGEDLWLGTNHGLHIWDRSKNSLIEVMSQEGEKIEGEIHDILTDSKGRIWLATNNQGLIRLEEESHNNWVFDSYYSSSNQRLHDHRIFTVFEDSKHRIWIGTESLGLNLYLEASDSFFAYQKNLSDGLSLKTNSIWEIFEDASGRLFFGSNNQGMFVHDPYAINFNHKDQQYGLRLKFSTVSSFLEVGENEMWIGTDGGGITVWNRETDQYSFLNHDENKKGTLGSNEVLTLYKDSQGIIWSGNWNGGLNKYDPSAQTFRTYKKSESTTSIGSNSVFGIDEDRHGDLWMSTWGHGVSRYNRATDDFFSIGYIPYNDNHMANDMTYDIEIDDLTGDIWVATVLGLDRVRMIDSSNYAITHFRYDQEKERSLSALNVHCIFEDMQHRLWIGTSNGLNLYDRKTEDFTTFFTQQGLPGNVIKDVIQDNNQIFWVSTTKGLAKMQENKEGFHIEVYHKSDGLQANEFFINSSYKTSSGELFLGGVNGFNHFDPNEFRPSPYGPKLQLTGFKLFNKEVEIGLLSSPLSGHINTLDKIILKKSQSAFSIEYHGLNMTSPEKHQYAYKLEGFDQDWNEVGHRTVATYTNMDAGDYVFMVKGENRDGVWSDSYKKIKITVLPPWWQTLWAKFIFIVSPLLFVTCIVLMRFSMMKSQKKQLATQVRLQTAELLRQKNEIEVQAEQLFEMNQQKNKLFSIISHDLRSPIYSLKGLTNILDPSILNAKDLVKIKENISHRIEDIGNVMVNVLDWSKSQMEGESVHLEAFNLFAISNEICKMYASAAIDKQVHLINSIPECLIVYADQNQIRVVLRNLLGNALKFTLAGDVVRINCESMTDKKVSIQVSDTGIGMTEDQLAKLFRIESNKSSLGTAGEKGVGLGLLLVKEFIEKNKGTISVESSLGKGTTFRFSLPRT